MFGKNRYDNDDIIWIFQDVFLPKNQGPLGFSIIGGTDHSCVPFGAHEPGIFISHVSFFIWIFPTVFYLKFKSIYLDRSWRYRRPLIKATNGRSNTESKRYRCDASDPSRSRDGTFASVRRYKINGAARSPPRWIPSKSEKKFMEKFTEFSVFLFHSIFFLFSKCTRFFSFKQTKQNLSFLVKTQAIWSWNNANWGNLCGSWYFRLSVLCFPSPSREFWYHFYLFVCNHSCYWFLIFFVDFWINWILWWILGSDDREEGRRTTWNAY